MSLDKTADGAVRVKPDPGTPETDPKFYGHAFTVPASAGDHWFDLDMVGGTTSLQYLVLQVKNPVFGDAITVSFRLVSDDTVVGTFGTICPAMHTDASGWSVPRKEPQEIGSAKDIPAGVKVSVKYTAADASGHQLIVDTCCHE